MVELVIRGDCVVTPNGAGPADVAVAGGRVAAVAVHGTFPVPQGARLIDAAGKIVIPGGIDPHVHCLWHLPNPDGTLGLTQGPAQVSRAALFGGTTTMIDFVRWTHGNTIRGAIEQRHEAWRGDGCHADYAFHVMLEGDLPPDIPGQLGEAIEAGHPTVKIFTTDITPSRRGRMVDFRRHLGGVQGPGVKGWARRDPRRGQRHRHAHVRQAVPRGPHRLREHGGGAQHALGGPQLPARHPPGRERARHRALHDARQRRQRRARDP
jgi:hypothetical protein